jgi:hypothetical protein
VILPEELELCPAPLQEASHALPGDSVANSRIDFSAISTKSFYSF